MPEIQPRRFAIERFAHDLRMCRAERRVSGRSLEAQSSISNSFLSQVETHHRVPNIDSIIWLCDWMGKGIEEYIEVIHAE